MQYRWIYTGVFIALAGVVLAALGPGFWGGTETGLHWTEKLFYGICHQIPQRSFKVNDMPMAVNSRCFGIFCGLFSGWVMIPFRKKRTSEKDWVLWVLALAVILQIIDYTGNLLHWWENTNTSRVVTGGFLGIAASLAVSDLFFNAKKKKNEH